MGFPFPNPSFNGLNFGAFHQPGGFGGLAQNSPLTGQGDQDQFNPFVAFHPSNLYNQALNAFGNQNHPQQGFGQQGQGGQQPVQGQQGQGGQQPVQGQPGQGGQQPIQGQNPNQEQPVQGGPVQGGQQPISGQQQGTNAIPNKDGVDDSLGDIDQSQIDEIFQRPTESQ